MTVANQTNRTSVVGNAAIGQEVPIPFPYAATSDITVYSRVTATGVETLLTETTNYTLTAPSDTGGTLTTVTAVAVTSEIHIIRDTPKTQSLDLEQGGSFNAENIEDALDKNTKLAIENEDAISKAITFPPTDAAALTTQLPSSVDRASKVISCDSSGNITASSAVPTGSVLFSTFGTNMAETADAASARTLLDLGWFDVRAYGTTGDGIASENVAIAAAAAAAAGETLMFPPGTYLIDDDISIGATVQLVFLKGAQLSINVGKTFTIGGQSEAGYYEIFTGAGSVAFTTEIDNWKPEWFGTTLGIRNTFGGYQAGEDLTSGTANAVYGHRAGASITSGAKHTAVGAFALEAVTTVSNCTAVGYLAAQKNTALNITAIGSNALADNIGAGNATAVGVSALASQNNVLAIGNTAVGVAAGVDNTSGSNLTIVGARAMHENTTALNGVAVGVEAGHGNIHDEQILDGDFSVTDLPTGWTLGTGWAVDNSNNEVDKSSDGTGTLTATLTDGGAAYIDYGVGSTYQILYTIKNWTVGSVTVSFGGETDTARTADGDYTWNVTPSVFNAAARALTFTPSNTSRFSVTDVSFKTSTAASHSGLTAVGVGAGYFVTDKNNNTFIGIGAGRQNGGGENTTAVGSESFRQGGGSGCVGMGKQAGYYERGDNKLFIDNTARASEADGRLKALIYGIFASTVAEQSLTINASFHADRICFVDDEIVSLDNNLVSV